MKPYVYLLAFILVFSDSVCADETDDASELASLLFDRDKIESSIISNYQEGFEEFSDKNEIYGVLKGYLESDFPWTELHDLGIAAVRDTFTPAEQRELITFLKSPTRIKYSNAMTGPAWESISLLVERENQKLFTLIEKTIEQK